MDEYNEAEVKLRLILLLTHLFDQNMMDDEHLKYWVQWIKEAEAGY